MKRIIIIISAAALMLLPHGAAAQTASEETDFDFRGRASVAVDWKIRKRLHLEGGYELRTADKFSRVERNQLNIGIGWSPLKYLSVGGGYCFIGRYDSENTFKPRHRVYADVTGSLKPGSWKISLKEMVQLTHNAYTFNEYQNTPNLLELKSRLKVAYKGLRRIEPYAYAELRNCFNAPSFDCEYNASKGKYTDYEFLGYRDAYVNRIRGALGLEWNISRHHTLDFRFMNDWSSDRDIDVNAKGTKLKSWCWEKGVTSSLCVGYVFSF